MSERLVHEPLWGKFETLFPVHEPSPEMGRPAQHISAADYRRGSELQL